MNVETVRVQRYLKAERLSVHGKRCLRVQRIVLSPMAFPYRVLLEISN